MKKWYESRTIWLGIGTIATALGAAIGAGATWQEAVLATVGALVVYLRTVTTKAVS